MPTRPRQRRLHFAVTDGHLVRTVTFPGEQAARGYMHRCPLATYEAVAHAVAETPAEGDGTTLEVISRAEGLPFSQVNVAMEFLKERGIVEVRCRRCYPGSADVYLDAMVEYHALREGAPGAAAPSAAAPTEP